VAVKSIVSEFVNETDESSARFYLAKLDEIGVNPNELSFVELVAVTRKWHGEWQRSDERRDERDAIAEAREAARKVERLAALAKRRDSLVASAKRDAERAAKRDAALAELAEAGLLDS
jgi:regulator of protease activity HflC (stomatin/prohibitin superfamily)